MQNRLIPAVVYLFASVLATVAWAQEGESSDRRGPQREVQNQDVGPSNFRADSRFDRNQYNPREAAGDRVQRQREWQYSRGNAQQMQWQAREQERLRRDRTPNEPTRNQQLQDDHFRNDSLKSTYMSPAQSQELRNAVDSVQRATNGKILGAETLHTRGQSVHRIKVYTPEGRVRVVQIPVQSNEQHTDPATQPKEEH